MVGKSSLLQSTHDNVITDISLIYQANKFYAQIKNDWVKLHSSQENLGKELAYVHFSYMLHILEVPPLHFPDGWQILLIGPEIIS